MTRAYDSLNDTKTCGSFVKSSGVVSRGLFCRGLLGPQDLQYDDQSLPLPGRAESISLPLEPGHGQATTLSSGTLSHMMNRLEKHLHTGASSLALGTLKPPCEQARASLLEDGGHAEKNQGSQATNLLTATQVSGDIPDLLATGQPQTQGKSNPQRQRLSFLF